MNRIVQPELLDLLPANDPRAIGSRRDLLRLNSLMRHPQILAGALAADFAHRGTLSLIDLGGGDGRLLLEVARRLGRRSPAQRVEALLVDRENALESDTQQEFHKLNWNVGSAKIDVSDFLKSENANREIIVANLFFHHFAAEQLKDLLAQAAHRTQLFVTLEPRRAPGPWLLSRLVGLIGCNAVTRHDARISVEAGFTGKEISRLWPRITGWNLAEHSAGWCSHLFTARKTH